MLGGLSGGGMVSEFDTSLGLRLDYEAAAAYLALPPLGPIVLLILERKSDYVRLVARYPGDVDVEGEAWRRTATMAQPLRLGSLVTCCSLSICCQC